MTVMRCVHILLLVAKVPLLLGLVIFRLWPIRKIY